MENLKDNIIKALAKDEGYSIEEATNKVNNYQLENINYDVLKPVIELWLESGKISNFNVEGISLTDIMHKEKCDFVQALFSMSVLIENSEIAKHYNEIEFHKE